MPLLCTSCSDEFVSTSGFYSEELSEEEVENNGGEYPEQIPITTCSKLCPFSQFANEQNECKESCLSMCSMCSDSKTCER